MKNYTSFAIANQSKLTLVNGDRLEHIKGDVRMSTDHRPQLFSREE
jgi:hypothetical protein